jgi:hypothetical protein
VQGANKRDALHTLQLLLHTCRSSPALCEALANQGMPKLLLEHCATSNVRPLPQKMFKIKKN